MLMIPDYPNTTTASPEVAASRLSRYARGCALVRSAAAAIRRWRARRWLKRNHHRIVLIASEGHELSERGQRVRAETLEEMRDQLRGLGQFEWPPWTELSRGRNHLDDKGYS